MYLSKQTLSAAKHSNSLKSVREVKQSDNSMLYLSLAFAVGALLIGLILS